MEINQDLGFIVVYLGSLAMLLAVYLVVGVL